MELINFELDAISCSTEPLDEIVQQRCLVTHISPRKSKKTANSQKVAVIYQIKCFEQFSEGGFAC